MSESLLDGAAWIWSDEADQPANNFVAFRREFECTERFSEAVLSVTADARYELFVNGRWMGFGPPRSWHDPWPVDEYLIGPMLHQGRNVIAVLVQEIGHDTFQYITARPGLAAN